MNTHRWITAAIAEAETCEIKMPWARGARRAAWIAKRTSEPCALPQAA